MNSYRTHPEEVVLLRYVDGEMPGRKARRIARHLQACWQCRTAIEDLQSTVADCVRYRNQVLAACLPAPPVRWPELADGFARVDADLAAESWMKWLAAPKVRRWAISFAAAALLAAGVFYQLRDTPPVEAAVLLKRAVANAASHPQRRRQIRVRTRNRDFAVAPPAVRALFRSARYDADDPLSARSYQQWRDGLSTKTDDVIAAKDAYRIRTVTPEGALAVASLTLRAADLHPTEGRFEFRNREWVELTEVPEASTRDDGPSVETNVEAPMRRAVPSRPMTATTEGPASISDELQVMAALHEIGADLGDPVEVSRSGGRVLVSGIGVSPKRQTEIREALSSMPKTAIQFTEPPAAPEVPADSTSAPSGAKSGAIQSRIEQQVGGRAEFARFSAQVLERSESAMARAYALRALAQRFPEDAARGLSAADREVLTAMARAHLTAMSSYASDIQRTLGPVLAGLGGVPAPDRPLTSRAAWQAAAEDLLRAGRRVELLISSALGVTQDSVAPDRLPSDLIAAMAELRAILQQGRRLVDE